MDGISLELLAMEFHFSKNQVIHVFGNSMETTF